MRNPRAWREERVWGDAEAVPAKDAAGAGHRTKLCLGRHDGRGGGSQRGPTGARSRRSSARPGTEHWPGMNREPWIKLAHRWSASSDAGTPAWAGTSLPASIAPGASALVSVEIEAPKGVGRQTLECELVHEDLLKGPSFGASARPPFRPTSRRRSGTRAGRRCGRMAAIWFWGTHSRSLRRTLLAPVTAADVVWRRDRRVLYQPNDVSATDLARAQDPRPRPVQHLSAAPAHRVHKKPPWIWIADVSPVASG